MDLLAHTVYGATVCSRSGVAGKYQTMLFYALWEWKFPGISWWRHPGVVLLYWAIPPVTWVVLMVLRRQRHSAS